MSRPRKNLTRYRLVVKLRDKDGKKFREIAEELKISRQRVWQIYSRATSQGSGVTRTMTRHGMGNLNSLGVSLQA